MSPAWIPFLTGTTRTGSTARDIVDHMDNKDTFEVLADISLPELQHTQSNSNIAGGPFVVEYGTDTALGARLNILPSGMIYFLYMNKVKYIPKGTPTAVDASKQTITFSGEGGAPDVTLRPITASDLKSFYPGLSFVSIDEFKDFIARKADQIAGSHDDLSDYAITMEDDAVLGLFHRADNKFFRREKKNWVQLTKDEMDWADIEDKVWTPVLSGAVDVFDGAASKDSVSSTLFDRYIVP